MVGTRALDEQQNEAWVLHLAARLPIPLAEVERRPELRDTYETLVQYRKGLSLQGQKIFDFLVDEKRLPESTEDEEYFQLACKIRRQARAESGRAAEAE